MPQKRQTALSRDFPRLRVVSNSRSGTTVGAATPQADNHLQQRSSVARWNAPPGCQDCQLVRMLHELTRLWALRDQSS